MPEAGTPDAGPLKLAPAQILRLLRLAVPYRLPLIGAALLMLVSTGVSLALPLLARTALDRVIQTHDVRVLDRLALAMLGLILLSSAVSYGGYVLVACVGNRVVRDLRARLFGHLQRLPVAFFDRTRSGDLASRLSTDATLIQQVLTDGLVRLVGNLVTLVGGMALAVVIDARLTGVVMLMLVATLASYGVIGMRLRRLMRESLDALSDAMGAMTEALGNVRLIKAFAREAYEDRRVGEKLGRVLHLYVRSSAFEAGLGAAAGASFISVMLGIIWYGGRSVLLGRLSAGSLLAFFMTITIISGPMASLASLYAQLQRAVGAADRLFALLDEAPEPADEPGAHPFPDGPGAVTYTEVTFAYAPDIPVLRGLSLEIPAGRVTALVGASGAGKTTLALLLYRFYEPQEGCIAIDGVPVETIARASLREHIGLVPQEPILFNGTIRENIRYGRLDATDAEVEEAARMANVAEFVEPLPLSYETILGERGITLSGGQRQRVAIARAVLKNPRILVLDEATSALDTRSEALVREALERLMRGRTTIVIAHRLTTVQNADQIAVIDEGRVAELGTHDDLLRAGGRYTELHKGVGCRG